MAAPVLAAAAGAQALGAIMGANSQAAMLESQSAAARYNATISRQQADQALKVSTAQQLAQQRQARQSLAAQRVAIIESGTGLGGSNRDVYGQSEVMSELDKLNLAYEGAVKSRGYLAQSDLDEFNARVYSGMVGPTKRAGYLSAVGSIGRGIYGAKTGSFV